MSSRTMAVDFWITGGLSFLYFPIFLSVETARQIDEEVRAIVERNYKRARKLLTDNLDRLHAMSDALVRYETLDAEQIEGIMAGREPRPPGDSDDRRGSGPRPEASAGTRPHANGIPAPQAFVQEPALIDRENARQKRAL